MKRGFPSSRRMTSFHVYEKSKGRQTRIWGGETSCLTYRTPASCQEASTLLFVSWPPSQRLWGALFSTASRGQLSPAPQERPGPPRRGRLAEAALTINQAPGGWGRLALAEAEWGGESQADWSRDQQTDGLAAVSRSLVRERGPCAPFCALAPPLVLPRPSLSPRPFFPPHCGAAGGWHSVPCAPRGAPLGRGGEANPETNPPTPAKMRLPLGGGGG